MSLISELKRRNVFRVAILYGVAAWALLQVGDLLFGLLGLPAWTNKLLFAMLVLGFVPALIFSWVYELTPEGLKREHEVERNRSITAETARKLDLTVGALLIVAIVLLGINWYTGRRTGNGDVAATQPAALAPAPGSGAPAAQASIAVLPFVNMSDDKANDYFSDGLSEELLNVLAKVQGLRVIARTSSFAFRGQDATIADVAKALSVDHVLEGSVRKAGDRVRITAQLIRARDSSHLWSETYDRTLDDVFAIQEEISGQVVGALKVRLLGAGTDLSEVGGTENGQAYEAFLRGLHILSQGRTLEQNLRDALAAFDLAVAGDASYAQGHAGRARVLSFLASNGYEPYESGFARAREAALQATRLAPDLAEAYLPLAWVAFSLDQDARAALAYFDRALTLNPGSAEVQSVYSFIASSVGLADEAVDAAKNAVRLDPLSAEAHRTLSSAYYGARRYAESREAARRALALDPDFPGGHADIGYALLEMGHSEAARAEFEKESVDWMCMSGIVLADVKLDRTQLAREGLAAIIEQQGDNWAYQYAQINAQLGDADASFRWLDTARRIKDPAAMTILSDPLLDPLREDVRYKQLVQDLGLADLRRRG